MISAFRGASAGSVQSVYEYVRERCVLCAGLRVRVCVLSFVPSRIRALLGDVSILLAAILLQSVAGCGWHRSLSLAPTERHRRLTRLLTSKVNARRIPSRACRRPSTSLSSHSLASIAAAACVLSPLTPPRNSNSQLTPRSRSAPLSWAHLGYTRLA